MSLYADVSDVRSEMIRSLCRWWLSRCADDIPDRADFDPAEMTLLLPNLFIADVEHQPFRIRFRLVGTRAVEATGMDITGCYLDELLPPNPDEPWLEYYRRACEERVPVFGSCEAPTRSGGRFSYEFGLFPLRRGGREVAQFVSIEDYFDLTSTLTELKEWQEKRASEGPAPPPQDPLPPRRRR